MILIVLLVFLVCGNINITYAQEIQKKEMYVIKVDSLNDLSKKYSYINNQKALEFANQALELALTHEYKRGQAFAFRNLSSVYSEQFTFSEAIEFINRALDIFEELDDQEGIANCNISLGHTFSRLKLDSVAFDYHLQAFNYFVKENNIERKLISTHNLAQAYFLINDLDKATELFHEAILIANELGNLQLKSSCLSYLGEIAYKQGENSAATLFFTEVLEINQALKEDSQKYATMSAFYHMGLIHKNKMDFISMLDFFESGVKLFQNYRLNYYVTEIYEELIRYYKDIGDFKIADELSRDYLTLLKESNNLNIENKARLYLDFLKSRELEKEFLAKVQANEIQEEIAKANIKTIRVLVFLSLVLIILLVIIIYQLIINKRNSKAINSIYDNAKSAIILIDEKGFILKFNKATAKMFGIRSDDFKGKSFFKEFISESSDLTPEDLEQSLINDFTVKTKEGIEKEISVSCSQTLIDNKRFYACLILDRSDYKRLQRLNNFYQIILEKSNEIAKIGTWEISYQSFLKNEMPVISSKVFEMLEFESSSVNDLNNISWTKFFKSDESIKNLFDIFKDSVNNKAPFDIEIELQSLKGNHLWVRLIGSVEYLGANDYKLYGTVQDITEHKRVMLLMEENLNREQELNKLKSRFISMASHEFRTPLATITTSVELIQMNLEKLLKTSNSGLEKHTRNILNQIDRLENTLDSILMLEKSMQGKFKPVFESVDIELMLNEIVQCSTSLGDSRVPKLNIDLVSKHLMTDGNLLYHVLQNIISNALKYSKGKKEPEIFVKNISDLLVIEVVDFGIGIPESDKSGLFNSFYRAKNTTGIKGTGLGLSIVKEFIILLNGNVEISSKEGEGTKVKIELPMFPSMHSTS